MNDFKIALSSGIQKFLVVFRLISAFSKNLIIKYLLITFRLNYKRNAQFIFIFV
jgi:hypothetical protein